ncbi:MAG: sugar ABC transporter permease [Bacilli bacterium]|nr:sugar ABC transporter permease [Bacilli bacterium]
MLTLSKNNLRLNKVRINKQGYWHRVGQKLKKYGSIYWFVLPAAFLALLFGYIPLFFLLAAFKENVAFGRYGIQAIFMGGWTLDQFAAIFTTNSDQFFRALGNTLVINLAKLIFVFPLPIILAICLSEVKSSFLAKLFLIILCLPNFLSWPTVIGIWQNFFRLQDGVLNNIFRTKINFFDYNLLGPGVNLFRFFAVFFDAWKGVGWNSIMFYTAIMSIDKSYYEAAELEGATKLQQIRHLTLPSIFPIIALMFIMNITYILSCGFEQINLIAEWNPEFITHETTLDYYLYFVSLREAANYSFATALGLFNSTISLVFMLVGNKICRKFLNRGLW